MCPLGTIFECRLEGYEVRVTSVEPDFEGFDVDLSDLDLSGVNLNYGQSEMELGSLPGQSISRSQIQQLAPAALAYLGDAVYELHIRRCYLIPPKRLQAYHHQVVAHVRAEGQARCLQSLIPHLTAAELEIVRRGRNAATGGPKRVDANTYQQATSLETLIGYLYLLDPPRLARLLSVLELDPPPNL
jgi:ribonuclease III family protein